MSKQKQKPPEGWSEQDWRLYQEGMAAKKAEEEAERSGAARQDAPPTDERPAAEIVGDLMLSMPRPSGTESSRHRGPHLEIRHREVEPNPLVEGVKKLWNSVFKRKPKD